MYNIFVCKLDLPNTTAIFCRLSASERVLSPCYEAGVWLVTITSSGGAEAGVWLVIITSSDKVPTNKRNDCHKNSVYGIYVCLDMCLCVSK